MFYSVSYDLDQFLRNNSAGSDPERHTRRREVKDEVHGLMVRGKKQVRTLCLNNFRVECHTCYVSLVDPGGGVAAATAQTRPPNSVPMAGLGDFQVGGGKTNSS